MLSRTGPPIVPRRSHLVTFFGVTTMRPVRVAIPLAADIALHRYRGCRSSGRGSQRQSVARAIVDSADIVAATVGDSFGVEEQQPIRPRPNPKIAQTATARAKIRGRDFFGVAGGLGYGYILIRKQPPMANHIEVAGPVRREPQSYRTNREPLQ
jgi:hypothetical protein